MAGMFFVPASLFMGWRGGRIFVMTALGDEAGAEKVSAGMIMPLFSTVNTVPQTALVPLRVLPVPSLPLCRLAAAGGGTVKFQHLLRRSPNYYALLLRLPSLSLCVLRFPNLLGGAPQRPCKETPRQRNGGAPNSRRARVPPCPAQFPRSRHKHCPRAGASQSHTDPRIQ